MTHSPAPWTAFLDPMRRRTIGTATGRICDMWGQDPAFFTEEDAANARLIAASPDLLAALRQLMEWEGYDGGPPGNGHDEDTDRREQEVWQDAQGAIDKATKEEGR